ncbi:MAG TPA: HesA/MoeB/ThiF family protein [Desulfurococcales archaeon]|nr:HesA/MoeB/ThiF family protein [Desulfurococcales archaeon]
MERYDRQIKLFGVEAQLKLKKARVMVAGLGGLGCPAALYLVAAGVGKIVLVDRERVELSNLNRQILHWTRDIGELKVNSAAKKLRELNPEVDVEAIPIEINEDTVYDLVSQVDIVIDGMDNWKTRFILNRVCVLQSKPFIHAGVYGMHGQLLVVIPRKGPCLQCVIPELPPESKHPPVLGTTTGILALLEVTEAIKIITGYGEVSIGQLILYDGYTMSLNRIKVSRRENCPTCGLKN